MRGRLVNLGMASLLGLSLAGCDRSASGPPDPARPFAGATIVVVAFDDAAPLGPVGTQRGEWAETRGAEVSIRPEAIADPMAIAGVDVLIFRGDRLGDLMDANALAPIPDALIRPPTHIETPADAATKPAESVADTYDFNDVLTAYREQVGKFGPDRVGLPLGGSGLVLAYRKDAFEKAEVVEAAKAAGVALEPPATWEALDALARFLHGRDLDGDGSPEAGLALALGPDAEGVGAATFLARAAALGQHRDQFSFLYDAETMEPRIAGPPFVEALSALVALKDAGPEGVASFDAEAARAAFRSGKATLLIDRAGRVGDWANPESPRPIGVAPLPGSARVYDPARAAWEAADPPNRPAYLPYGGGWLAGVTASSSGKNREAALDFVAYLTAKDTAARLRGDKVVAWLPARAEALSRGLADPRSAPGVDGRRWSEAVTRTLSAPRVVVGHRIPGAVADLADLEAARVAAVRGQDPAEALEAAAKSWSARTESFGRDRRRWHYRRTLQGLATPPRPPPPTPPQ